MAVAGRGRRGRRRGLGALRHDVVDRRAAGGRLAGARDLADDRAQRARSRRTPRSASPIASPAWAMRLTRLLLGLEPKVGHDRRLRADRDRQVDGASRSTRVPSGGSCLVTVPTVAELCSKPACCTVSPTAEAAWRASSNVLPMRFGTWTCAPGDAEAPVRRGLRQEQAGERPGPRSPAAPRPTATGPCRTVRPRRRPRAAGPACARRRRPRGRRRRSRRPRGDSRFARPGSAGPRRRRWSARSPPRPRRPRPAPRHPSPAPPAAAVPAAAPAAANPAAPAPRPRLLRLPARAPAPRSLLAEERLERLGHLGGRREALLRVRCQRLAADRLERRRDPAVGRRRARHRAGEPRGRDRRGRVAGPGPLAR